MPALDHRLQSVVSALTRHIDADATHCDVGSDHGYLLRRLLLTKKIRCGIAIENKPAPFENSRRALAGLCGEARLGDGLSALAPGEANSLTICGMGSELIVRILQSGAASVPPLVVLQANRQSHLLRMWGKNSGYHLIDECCVQGKWWYDILTFARGVGEDPIYQQGSEKVSLHLGPWLVKRWAANTERRYRAELKQLSAYPKLTADSLARKLALEEAFRIRSAS